LVSLYVAGNSVEYSDKGNGPGKLKPYLSSDAKFSWAVLYDDPNPELTRLINQQAPEELERMILANL
jgi:hypothetical protein